MHMHTHFQSYACDTSQSAAQSQLNDAQQDFWSTRAQGHQCEVWHLTSCWTGSIHSPILMEKKPVVNFLFIGQKLGMRTFDSNVVFNILSSGWNMFQHIEKYWNYIMRSTGHSIRQVTNWDLLAPSPNLRTSLTIWESLWSLVWTNHGCDPYCFPHSGKWWDKWICPRCPKYLSNLSSLDEQMHCMLRTKTMCRWVWLKMIDNSNKKEWSIYII